MAMASEIFGDMKNAGDVIPGRIDTLRNTTPGLTEQLFTNNLLDSLGESYPRFTDKLERNDDAAVPTLAAVVAFLGTKDKTLKDDSKDTKGAKTAIEKFIADFPQKSRKWKEYITKEPSMGKKGWDTVVKLWQQASTDKMYENIRKDQFAAMNGLDPETGEIIHPLDWMAGKLGGAFTPRRQRAFEQGRDPTLSETFMDIAQNVAYMVPVGAAEAAAARGIANPLASKILGAAVGSAIAPAAIAAGDYALDSKPYSGVEDAAVDAAIGTATNLGVGKVAGPLLGQLANLGNVRGRIPQSIIDFLQGTKFERSKARDLISEAEQALKKHANETNAQYAQKLRKGKTPDRLTDEQAIKYEDILAARDYAKNAQYKQEFADAWRQGMENGGIGATKPVKDPTLPRSEWNDLLNVQNAKKTINEMVDQAMPDAAMHPDLSKGTYANYLEDFGGDEASATARALKEHPELISLFDDRTLKQIMNDPELLFDMGRTWAVNKMGNDAAASRLLSRYGIDVGDLRKWQDESRKKRDISVTAQSILDADASATARTVAEMRAPEASTSTATAYSSTVPNSSSSVSEVLAGPAAPQLSPQSVQFLKDIESDPTIVMYGHRTRPEEFKEWLIREGHDLLSGTPAARPTWEVK